MKHSEYSVVIVGSGAAGLYCALKLADSAKLPDGVLMITKSGLGESNSMYAQGGIVGVMRDNTGDSVKLHVEDTLRAGAGLSDENVTEYISELSDEVINDLMRYGVKFDCDNEGRLNYTLEAAHSYKRIMHSGGDATGRGITVALAEKVRNNDGITVAEDSMAVELLVDSGRNCKGIVCFNILTGEHEIIYTNAVVLATGGIGQVYKYTTNPDGATGDGIDLAYNAGAIMRDMEFVQFHPTALALSATSRDRFLISEAVRGEGAKLTDADGREFMAKYHDKRELAPRDVVTRAIYNEMRLSHRDNVFLNASILDSNRITKRFPNISLRCRDNGIDITKSPIPVAPAAHYYMGGVKAEVNGKTSIKGLYAIGEVASTGLHGANRLASNSLLECAVCAYELADYLSFANLEPPKAIDSVVMDIIKCYESPLSDTNYDVMALKDELKSLMWNDVGIIRCGDGLQRALSKLRGMREDFRHGRKCLNAGEYEYRNMLTTALLIAETALERKESRGAHTRSDYKGTDEIAVHSEVSKNMKMEFSDVK